MTRKGQSLYDWCIENGEYGQQLINEWTGHGEDTKEYNMIDITYGSQRKLQWKCKDKHIWYATIVSRTTMRTKCPTCFAIKQAKISAINKVKPGINDIYTWCTQNGKYGQQLIDEWRGIDEKGDYIHMSEICAHSMVKVLWECSNGHEWYAPISYRTSRQTQCKKCSTTPVTCNETLEEWCNKNADYGQQLIREFQGTDEQGNEYNIAKLAKSSSVKVLWRCSKGHEWYASINYRVLGHNTCPICRSLLVWCEQNGEFGRLLQKEFTGVCDDGNLYRIHEVGSKSPKRIMWRCNKEHTWYTSIASRTSKYTYCPYCASTGTSYPEQFLYRALIQLYPQTITRGKFKGIEYDLTIPEEKTCIEYSGYIWHKDKAERDQMKADICKEHDVRFIQIYAHHGEIDTSDSIDSDFIIYKADYNNKEKHNQQLTEILDHILKSFGHSISEIDIEKAQTEAFNFMHNIGENNQ